MFRKTYLKVNVDNCLKNLKGFTNVANKKLMGIIKADAYGLGDYQMATYLEKNGTDFFAVSSIEEALRLRDHGIKSNILVLGYVHDVEICKNNNISVIIPTRLFIEEHKDNLKGLKVHIKINTGLNRLGIFPKDLKDVINDLESYGAIIEGVMTHYAIAEDKEYTMKQYKIFEEVVKNSNYNFKYIHTAATDAALYLEDSISNYIRIGLGLLGVSYVDSPFKLENVVTLTAEVIDCKKLNKGEGVSYGHYHIADGDGYYLTCAIGYADGIDFKYSGTNVYVNGQIGTIVGKVCMDLLVVKVDNPCKIGDEVELIGEHITMKQRIKELNTNYQKLITDIDTRVTRQYYIDGKLDKELNYKFKD